MKLIIDVDEEIVRKGFEQPLTEEERATLIRAIGNGKSYNPTGDCISRSGLKKEVEHLKETGYDTNNEPLFDFIELTTLFKAIDNAPTVKFSLLPADESKDEAYMRGYEHGLAVGLLKTRPQGEWINHTDGYIAFYTCNKCNNFGDIQDKFCKHCGADMKGGEGE